MGKRGPKPGFNPKRNISRVWTPSLAYAIGLLATDGCMARRTTLIDLTSKDREQLENFNKAVGVDFTIGQKQSSAGNQCMRVQFKSVLFYNFLLSIGLTPAKSKTLGAVRVPPRYFFDFLRGCFDGDGSTYSYWDPRWRSSFMFYTAFVSASRKHIDWLQKEIFNRLGIQGHRTGTGKKGSVYQLKYAKADSLKLLRKMYPTKKVLCLSRKRLKIERMLAIIGERL